MTKIVVISIVVLAVVGLGYGTFMQFEPVEILNPNLKGEIIAYKNNAGGGLTFVTPKYAVQLSTGKQVSVPANGSLPITYTGTVVLSYVKGKYSNRRYYQINVQSTKQYISHNK